MPARTGMHAAESGRPGVISGALCGPSWLSAWVHAVLPHCRRGVHGSVVRSYAGASAHTPVDPACMQETSRELAGHVGRLPLGILLAPPVTIHRRQLPHSVRRELRCLHAPNCCHSKHGVLLGIVRCRGMELCMRRCGTMHDALGACARARGSAGSSSEALALSTSCCAAKVAGWGGGVQCACWAPHAAPRGCSGGHACAI